MMLAYKKNEENTTADKNFRKSENKANVINFSDMRKYDLLLQARLPKSTFSLLSEEDKNYVLSSDTPEVFGTGEEFELRLS